MTHKEAVEEMKKLAKGSDWSVTHDTASWHGSGIASIQGYIAGIGTSRPSPTYAGAIENVKEMLSLIPCDPAPEDGTNSSRPDPLE